jgi:hypothetical protein
MKEFCVCIVDCVCIVEWELGFADFPLYKRNIQITLGKRKFCSICGLYYWNDPHYENMMFDLKNMNN